MNKDLKTKKWNKKKVLIVEDEYINRRILKLFLKSTEISILECDAGDTSVDFVKNNEDIDLILMDIKLPGMNGIDATKMIKEIRPQLPVIAQTAYASTEDQEKYKEAGFDDFLAKPIDRDILYTILDSYLS